MTDIHCHIIPLVDDGAKSWEQAENMLRMAYEDGIRNIVVTPHWQQGRFMASCEECEDGLALLQEMAEQRCPGLSLYPGREALYDPALTQRWKDCGIHTLADSRYLLIEFVPFTQFYTILDAIRQLQAEGLVPVIAHAERYLCLQDNDNGVDELRRYGAFVQMNADSLMGKLGAAEKRRMKRWIKRGFIDFIASDAHSDGRRAPLLNECRKYVRRHFGTHMEQQIFFENPERILQDIV